MIKERKDEDSEEEKATWREGTRCSEDQRNAGRT